jgi:DNA helicase-2/ATP-dependent DNA helicase PcrA
MLVIAGAGSGKTRVLTYRVAYLIAEKNVQPEKIMAITFTNKAASEMKDRTISLVGKSHYHPWVATFHRTCADILRNYGDDQKYLSRFTVFDESEQVVVVKRVMKKLGLEQKENTPKSFLYRISRCKSHLMTPEECADDAKGSYEEMTSRVYSEYQKELKTQCAYDFDDLISEACRMLRDCPSILDRLRCQFSYLLVDEFQDINPAQYEFIKHITNPQTKNVFVVGDDDQAIYSWRYADPEFMDRFQKDFMPVRIIKLEENYRSTQSILNVANEIIKLKSWGITKTLRTTKPEGECPVFFLGQSDTDEAYYIARTIQEKIETGGMYNECAVLYRTNAQSRSFEEVLGRLGIPFQIIGGIRFYQRMEIKDILGYFRVLVNDKDLASLDRIINTPKRGLGDKSKEQIFDIIRQNNTGFFEFAQNFREYKKSLPNATAKHLAPFLDMMLEFRKKSSTRDIGDLLDWMLKETRYEKLLEKEDTIESQARLDNINELRGAFASFMEEYPDEKIDRFLEQVSLVSDLDSFEEKKDKVTLMTLHSAKGLEFDTVFLPGVEEGLLPHTRAVLSLSLNEMDEERRLFYVGVTRAKDSLFLSCVRNRWSQGQVKEKKPSRFLDDIPHNLVKGMDVLDLEFRMMMSEPEISWRSKPKKKKYEDDDYTADYDVMPSDDEKIKTRIGSSSSSSKPKKKPVRKIVSDYSIGDIVSHKTFGEGKIADITYGGGDDNFLTIKFSDDIGVKMLSEKSAPLKKK